MASREWNPYPELVDSRPSGKSWTINTVDPRTSRTLGSVDKRSRVLNLIDDERARGVSRHELAHIAWSPVAPPPVEYDPRVIQSVEDARVNLGLCRVGLGRDHEVETDQEDVAALFAYDLAGRDFYNVVLRAIACIGTTCEPIGAKAVASIPVPQLRAIGQRALERLPITLAGTKKAHVAPFKVTVAESERIAAELARFASEPPPEPAPTPVPQEGATAPTTGDEEPGDEEAPSESAGGESNTDRGRGVGDSPVTGRVLDDEERTSLREESVRAAERVRAAAQEGRGATPDFSTPIHIAIDPVAVRDVFLRAERRAKAERVRTSPIPSTYVTKVSREEREVRHGMQGTRLPCSRPDCGTAFLTRPRLTVRQQGIADRLAREPRCAAEGTMIRRVDRYLVDGAIFARRARTGDSGPVVLVDVSGSMSLSVEEVEAICLAAGNGATVATYCGNDGIGEVRIVAEGEYRASAEWLRPRFGGNAIDLPALEWLARQRGSLRVWVSDEGVSGSGAAAPGLPTMLASCLSVVEAHALDHVLRVDDCIAMLKERRGR